MRTGSVAWVWNTTVVARTHARTRTVTAWWAFAIEGQRSVLLGRQGTVTRTKRTSLSVRLGTQRRSALRGSVTLTRTPILTEGAASLSSRRVGTRRTARTVYVQGIVGTGLSATATTALRTSLWASTVRYVAAPTASTVSACNALWRSPLWRTFRRTARKRYVSSPQAR